MTNLKNLGVLLCLLGTSIAFLLPVGASAQGLKGAQMPPEILGRVIYVKGDTDQERWKNFVAVQSSLIGMSFKQADEALCGKISHKVMTEAEYGLTQEQVKVGKTKGCLYLRVFYRDGLVWKYSVEASH
jgi:hypothetical protein